jgi:hypothetical protein
MTIAKAKQGDKLFCRRVNTMRVARWRARNRKRYNRSMKLYMRKYLARKRETATR